jgi:dTDP-glucose 4,6-dehydratase
LLKEGLRVMAMDNFITGSPRNISHLVKDKSFHFIRHDVTRHIKIKGELDYVLHLASVASPREYLRHPIETLKSGSLGTHNALGLAREKQAVFLLASTSEVYGDSLVHPQPESYWGNVNSVGLRGCYDESKRFAEALTMAYHRVHKIDIKIARIFNTYGPRMQLEDGRVVPNFIYQALKGLGLTVYGRGQQTRSFCYVDDLVEGIWRLMRSKLNLPVNLGNSGEFTILELAKLVMALTKTRSRIIYKPLPQDDPRQRKPDIRLAKKALKWQPNVPLAAGLEPTIAWFQNRLHRGSG